MRMDAESNRLLEKIVFATDEEKYCRHAAKMFTQHALDRAAEYGFTAKEMYMDVYDSDREVFVQPLSGNFVLKGKEQYYGVNSKGKIVTMLPPHESGKTLITVYECAQVSQNVSDWIRRIIEHKG